MKHFFSTKVRAVLIIALLLAVGLTVISNLTGLSFPDMMVKGVLTPIRTAASKLTDQAEQFYGYMRLIKHGARRDLVMRDLQ